MNKTFRPYSPNQMLLLPPALQDWLPKDHLVYLVSDMVDSLDLLLIPAKSATDSGRKRPHVSLQIVHELRVNSSGGRSEATLVL